MLPVHMWLKVILIVLISVWSVSVTRQHCWHIGSGIREAVLRADDTWLLSMGINVHVSAELLPNCLIQPWLTVLRFRLPDGKRKSLILLPDNVDADVFRRVRVRLKYLHQ